MNRLSARVAAHGLRRQVTALNRADALGNAADRIVGRTWRQLLSLLQSASGPHDALPITHAAIRLFAPLGPTLTYQFGRALTALAVWGHREAAAGLASQIPRPMLAVAALTEDESTPPLSPGFVTLTPQGVQPFALPPGFADLSADAQRDLFQSLIFPSPPEEAVKQLVYASGWSARLGAETSLAAPRDIAAAVMRSITAGQSIRDLARDLLPIVDGVRSTARRVARDESMRVSHAMQRAADDQIDELILGRQVFAVDNGHSPTSRPEHKRRHGTIYYKKPVGDQKPMSDCPNPPYEADGTLAYNCRCWTSPVLMNPDDIAAEPVQPGTVDPDLTAAWFDEAPERDRRTAVGVERYRIVKDRIGRKPGWRDFIGASGELLDVEQLAGAQ